MNWVRLILIVLASLTALSGAALAWLVYADLAFLKPRIETYVREVTQRDFAISGPFSLEFGWQITATAQGISLGNSDWGEVTNMAEIEQARVEVDVGSLLDGPVVINLVEIRRLNGAG